MSSDTGLCCTWITRVSRRSGALWPPPASVLASALGTMRAWSPWATTVKPWVLITERNNW